MSTNAPSTYFRVCSSCFLPLPLSNFRLRDRAGERRRGECQACHARAMRLRRAKASDKELQRFIGHLARSRDTKRLSALVAAMVHRFGGIEPLAKRLFENIAAAKPGSRQSATNFVAIVSLATAADQLERAKPNLNEVPTDELRRQLAESVAAFVGNP